MEDLELTATANGRYEQFNGQRVEIFEFLEWDELTLMHLRDLLQTEDFDKLLSRFKLLPPPQ